MPWLSRFFGIHPWDLDQLTPLEIDVYLTALQEMTNDGG